LTGRPARRTAPARGRTRWGRASFERLRLTSVGLRLVPGAAWGPIAAEVAARTAGGAGVLRVVVPAARQRPPTRTWPARQRGAYAGGGAAGGAVVAVPVVAVPVVVVVVEVVVVVPDGPGAATASAAAPSAAASPSATGAAPRG